MHSVKNNQNFHVKSESGTAEADATVYVWLLLTHTRISGTATQHIHTVASILSNCERLGFYANILNIFGTVCLMKLRLINK